MGDDSRTPPLSRRVPGAAHAGPAQSAQRVLSDSVLDGMQAAIDAAHAKASGRSEPEPMTEPLQRIPAATLTAKAQAADERPQLPDQLHDYSDQEPPTEPLPRLNFAGAISSDVLSPAVEEISEQPDRVPPPIRSLQPPERLRPPDRVLQRPDRLLPPVRTLRPPGRALQPPDRLLPPDRLTPPVAPAPDLAAKPEPVFERQPAEPELGFEPGAAEPKVVFEPQAAEPQVEPELVFGPQAAEPQAEPEPAFEPWVTAQVAAAPEVVFEPQAAEPEPAFEPRTAGLATAAPEVVSEPQVVEPVIEPGPVFESWVTDQRAAAPEAVSEPQAVEPEPVFEPQAVEQVAAAPEVFFQPEDVEPERLVFEPWAAELVTAPPEVLFEPPAAEPDVEPERPDFEPWAVQPVVQPGLVFEPWVTEQVAAAPEVVFEPPAVEPVVGPRPVVEPRGTEQVAAAPEVVFEPEPVFGPRAAEADAGPVFQPWAAELVAATPEVVFESRAAGPEIRYEPQAAAPEAAAGASANHFPAATTALPDAGAQERFRTDWQGDRPQADRQQTELPQAEPQQSGPPATAGRRYGVISLVAAVLFLITLGGVGVALTLNTPPTAVRDSGKESPAPQSHRTTIRSLATSWVIRQVNRDAIVSCDPAMCSALAARGFPATSLRALGATSPFPVRSDVIIVTAAVRDLFGSSLGASYASEVLATFGAGQTRIDVRVITPHGAAAYRAALGRDLQLRKVAGAGLLNSRQIMLSVKARKQLIAGQVDSRLLVVITALAAQQPIDIVRFAGFAAGASTGTPLRFADLTPMDPAAHLTSSEYLRSMLTLLRAQPVQYRPARVHEVRLPTGQRVLEIQFDAPSPLGLLSPKNS